MVTRRGKSRNGNKSNKVRNEEKEYYNSCCSCSCCCCCCCFKKKSTWDTTRSQLETIEEEGGINFAITAMPCQTHVLSSPDHAKAIATQLDFARDSTGFPQEGIRELGIAPYITDLSQQVCRRLYDGGPLVKIFPFAL